MATKCVLKITDIAIAAIVGICFLVFGQLALLAQDSAAKGMIQPTGAVETVHTGFSFTEGPAWDPRGVLYFSDIPNTTIFRVGKEDKLSKFTTDSKHTNGITAFLIGVLTIGIYGNLQLRKIEKE